MDLGGIRKFNYVPSTVTDFEFTDGNGLNEVILQSPNLQRVCLSNCFTLRKLDVSQCPKLQTLLLNGCKELKSTGILPNSIEALNLDDCEKIKQIEKFPDSMVDVIISKTQITETPVFHQAPRKLH